jgi:pilus assembly protein Flp/PilA
MQTLQTLQSLYACLKDRRGVTAIEYGLIAALIAAAIILALTAVGNNLTTLFNTIAGSLKAP